jgi:hypothetical protein
MDKIRIEFMNIRNFDLVSGMQIRTKGISALLPAVFIMAPAAAISATTYNDSVKTNFSHRTIIRTRRSSMRMSFRVRSRQVEGQPNASITQVSPGMRCWEHIN